MDWNCDRYRWNPYQLADWNCFLLKLLPLRALTISVIGIVSDILCNNFNIGIVIDIISITIPNIEIVDTIYDNNFNIEIVIDIISITIPNIEMVVNKLCQQFQYRNCDWQSTITISILNGLKLWPLSLKSLSTVRLKLFLLELWPLWTPWQSLTIPTWE